MAGDSHIAPVHKLMGVAVAGHLADVIGVGGKYLGFSHAAVDMTFSINCTFFGKTTSVKVKCTFQTMTAHYVDQAHILFYAIIVA